MRLTAAFKLASEVFQIPALVSPTDFVVCCSDERCVVAVVATWYQRLNQDRVVKKSSTRLAVVLQRAVVSGRKLVAYTRDVHWLRRWIKANIALLNELGSKGESLDKMVQELRRWRISEKRSKLSELGQIEVRAPVKTEWSVFQL